MMDSTLDQGKPKLNQTVEAEDGYGSRYIPFGMTRSSSAPPIMPEYYSGHTTVNKPNLVNLILQTFYLKSSTKLTHF
jgi:hypothetical protein